MLRQRRRTLFCGLIFSALLLTSACGKKDTSVLEAENPVGAPVSPVVYDPTPTPVATYLPAPTSAPNYLPQGITEGPQIDFNRFNRTLGQCQGALNGNKGGLIGFLLRLLQGNSGLNGEAIDYDSTGLGTSYFGFGAIAISNPYYQYPQSQYDYPDYGQNPSIYTDNGFEPSQAGNNCMGSLRDRMGKIRQWMGGGFGGGGHMGGGGRFKPLVQNWLGHSTDWATSNVQYPQAWPNQQMPQGPMSTYRQGQTYFPRLQEFKGRLLPANENYYGYGGGSANNGNYYGGGNSSYTYGSGGNSYYQPAN